jgi:hypothetical protein
VGVDEILADPLAALELPDGSIPVLVEFAEPAADVRPAARRLATCSDDNLPPWTSIGMLRFAEQLELDSIGDDGEQE